MFFLKVKCARSFTFFFFFFLHKEGHAREQRFVDTLSKIPVAAQPPRVSTAHLNARQGLVGPNGVASDHVDPVVVNGDSGLVLT